MRTLLTLLLLLPILLFGQGAANTRFNAPTYLRAGDSTLYATQYDLTQISGTATITIADVVGLQDSLTDSWNKQDSATVLLSWARAASTYQPKGSYLTAETDPVWLSDSTDYMIKTDINARDTLTRTTLRAEYIAHDTLVKTGIRAEYVAHDTLVKTGLRAEYIGHDTLVQQYARSRDVLRLIATDTNNQVRAYKFDAAGDMLIGSGNNTYSKVAKGSNGQSWRTISGTPQWWADSVGAGGSGVPADSLAFMKGSTSVYLRDVNDNLGIGTTVPEARVHLEQNINGELQFLMKNTSDGTGAYSLYQASNGTYSLQNFMLGSGFTTSGRYVQNGVLINANGPGGLTFSIPHANGFISFYNASSEIARIAQDGKITSAPTYSVTVGATNRDLYIDNTGLIGYVSSTNKHKDSVRPLDNINWLYKLNPKTFVYRSDTGHWLSRTDTTGFTVTPSTILMPADTVWRDSTYQTGTATGTITIIVKVIESITPATYKTDTTYQTTIVKVKNPYWKRYKQYGLVAEEVDTINEYISSSDYTLNKDNTVTKEIATVNYSRLTVPLLKAIQDHQKEIDTLNRLIEVQTITPLVTGITKSQLAATMYISLSAPLDITGNKQIANGYDAQEIDLIGLSDVNTLKLDNGNNIQMTSSITLGKGDIATFKFVAPINKWILKSFTNN